MATSNHWNTGQSHVVRATRRLLEDKDMQKEFRAAVLAAQERGWAQPPDPNQRPPSRIDGKRRLVGY